MNELHVPGVNEGFTEITKTSSLTEVRKSYLVSLPDLLYFAEENNYCWNFAHDLLWRHDGRGIRPGELESYEFEGEEAENYEPRCAEIMRRFFRAYKITSVYFTG